LGDTAEQPGNPKRKMHVLSTEGRIGLNTIEVELPYAHPLPQSVNGNDITFDEDDNRVSRRNGAVNLALLRRLTLSLLKAHPYKRSIAKKRFAAALDTAFLEEVLSGDGILGNP
jgi:hypothetical protein